MQANIYSSFPKNHTMSSLLPLSSISLKSTPAKFIISCCILLYSISPAQNISNIFRYIMLSIFFPAWNYKEQ